MYKVCYTYTHPVAIVPVVQFDQSDWDMRNQFISYASQNGLVTTETRVIDPTTLIHEAIWDDQESWGACYAHGGQPYADWIASIKNRIEAAGGTYTVVESEV